MKIGKPTDVYKKLTGRLPKLGPDPSALEIGTFEYLKEESKMYVEIKHATDAKTLHAEGFHDWMRFSKYELEGRFEKDPEEFEAFIQGYILYFEDHDSFVGNEDRTIYFHWGKTNEKFDLIIYLKPLYARNYDDYETPMSHFPFSNPPTTVDPPPVSKIPPVKGK